MLESDHHSHVKGPDKSESSGNPRPRSEIGIRVALEFFISIPRPLLRQLLRLLRF